MVDGKPVDRRSRRVPLAEDDQRHGTENGYLNWKCRCLPCTKAASTARRLRARERAVWG